MSEGKPVYARFDKKDRANRCTLHGCERKIKANETYYNISVDMGYVSKHVRICKRCLITLAQTYLLEHPEFKNEVMEEFFGGNE